RRGLSTPATMVGELAVDARQVALCRTQCFFAVEWSGGLGGVAGQVGFFAGETILGSPELGAESVQEVVEALEEPDAARVLCAASGSFNGGAFVRRLPRAALEFCVVRLQFGL